MKHKIKIYGNDVVELYHTLKLTKENLIDDIMKAPKEISVYRLEFIEKIMSKLFKRFENIQSIKLNLSLSYSEILVVRYCLMQRRISPSMNELYLKIDSKIHPSIFERN